MNHPRLLQPWLKCLLWSALSSLALISCATQPKVDWNSRIGNYTFDQAVVDLGPPDKSATLTDGTQVAEWVTRRNQSTSFSVFGGSGYYGGGPGVSVGTGVGGAPPDRRLQLTFGKDGKLTSWNRNDR
jgi:hypothetical protein